MVKVTLSASERTNVSGFETLRLIGNGVAADNTSTGVGTYAGNSYNLTLTNDFINANSTEVGGNRILAHRERQRRHQRRRRRGGLRWPGQRGRCSGGVNIDARTLGATRSFSYNGDN